MPNFTPAQFRNQMILVGYDRAGVPGTAAGPDALHFSGMLTSVGTIQPVCLMIPNRDDSPSPQDECLHSGEVNSIAQGVFDACLVTHSKGERPVVIGGDHSVAIGSIEAAAQKAKELGRKFLCLYVDAHADFNTPDTSPTRNAHGMVLTAAAGLVKGIAATDYGQAFDPNATIMFGVRDVDVDEWNNINKFPDLDLISAADHEQDPRRIYDLLARRITPGTMVHVSFDVDSLDPSEFMATGLNVEKGLTIKTVESLFTYLSNLGCVCSADIVEYNPSKDSEDRRDAKTVSRLLQALLA